MQPGRTKRPRRCGVRRSGSASVAGQVRPRVVQRGSDRFDGKSAALQVGADALIEVISPKVPIALSLPRRGDMTSHTRNSSSVKPCLNMLSCSVIFPFVLPLLFCFYLTLTSTLTCIS